MADTLPHCLIGVEAVDIFQPSNLSLVKRHIDEVADEGLGNFMVFRAYRITSDDGPDTVLGDLASAGDMIAQLRHQKAQLVQPDSAATAALRYACERGMHCASLYTWFTPEAAEQIKRECGRRFLFPMLGEMHGGMGEEMGQPAEPDRGAPDLKALDARAVERIRENIKRHQKSGFRRVGHVDGPIHHDIGYRAGLHVSMTELMVGFVQLHLAATRGASDAFGKEFGSWIAVGFFGGANADVRKPLRLRAALNASYLSGAKYILLESGQWGLHEHGNNFGEGNQLTRELRHEVKRFYAFAGRHPRPTPRPEVPLGFVKGRFDGWSGCMSNGVVWRQTHGAPEYLTSSPERGWDYLDVIWPGKGRCDDYPLQDYRTPWLLGSPFGQVDIVPAETPASRLHRYRTLLFLGWNSMDVGQYRKLHAYVRNGGTLFMAVPHLATWTRRPGQFTNPKDMPLLRKGRFEDLFGVRVKGCGGYHDRINLIDLVRAGRLALPVGRRFIMETALFPALVELKMGKALARSHDGKPLLIENRIGKGTAYLLCSWDFPGLNAYQDFMRFLVGRFAEMSAGEVRVESQAPVEWAVFPGPSYKTVFMLNTQLQVPATATVRAPRGLALTVQLDPGDMRVAYVFKDMVLTFDDRMTALTDARRSRGWLLDVQGSAPMGLRIAVAKGLMPKEVRFAGDSVKEYGFKYPYYAFHFEKPAGRLFVETRKAR